jgi:hypothetical protein
MVLYRVAIVACLTGDVESIGSNGLLVAIGQMLLVRTSLELAVSVSSPGMLEVEIVCFHFSPQRSCAYLVFYT